jgi:hydroxysqualene dehydroxylase
LAPSFRLRLPRLPKPLHLAVGLLTARGLGLADKLAAARLMRRLEKTGFRLVSDQPANDFLIAHGQSADLIRHLWEPICVAALNTPLAIASAQVFCHVLRDSLAGAREASDMLFNRGDLGRLFPDAAAAHIRKLGGTVHLGARVTGLRPEHGGFRLDGVDAQASHVIIATHPARAGDLLTAWPDTAATRKHLAALTWQPIQTVWLRFAHPLNMAYPMLALGPGTAPWVFERQDLGPGLAALVASAEGPHLDLAPEALCQHWLNLLAARLGPLPELLDWKIITEKRATFACQPDLARPDNATGVDRLCLAGDYTAGDYPATLEGAVRSGIKSARLILETT